LATSVNTAAAEAALVFLAIMFSSMVLKRFGQFSGMRVDLSGRNGLAGVVPGGHEFLTML
jgi:hypothetical protein